MLRDSVYQFYFFRVVGGNIAVSLITLYLLISWKCCVHLHLFINYQINPTYSYVDFLFGHASLKWIALLMAERQIRPMNYNRGDRWDRFLDIWELIRFVFGSVTQKQSGFISKYSAVHLVWRDRLSKLDEIPKISGNSHEKDRKYFRKTVGLEILPNCD